MLASGEIVEVARTFGPLADVARELEMTIEPQHPGILDRELQRYGFALVDTEEAALRAIDRLSRLPTVDGAYVKPAGEPPM